MPAALDRAHPAPALSGKTINNPCDRNRLPGQRQNCTALRPLFRTIFPAERGHGAASPAGARDFSTLAMKASVSRKIGTSDRMMGAIAATMM